MTPIMLFSSQKEGSGQEVATLTGDHFPGYTLLEKIRFRMSVGLFSLFFLLAGLAVVCGILWVRVADADSRNEILQNAMTSALCKSDAKSPELCSILTDVTAFSGDSRTVSTRQHIRERREVPASPRGSTTVLSLNSDEIKLSHRNEVIGPFQVNLPATTGEGESIRFNSDMHTMTVIKAGVFSVYAQMMYHIDLSNNGPHDTDFLGYQIIMMHKSNDTIQPLAECVTPRLFKDSYATCFTQVTRFLDEGDQLQVLNLHFTPNGLSTIISDNPGQTFFGASRF